MAHPSEQANPLGLLAGGLTLTRDASPAQAAQQMRALLQVVHRLQASLQQHAAQLEGEAASHVPGTELSAAGASALQDAHQDASAVAALLASLTGGLLMPHDVMTLMGSEHVPRGSSPHLLRDLCRQLLAFVASSVRMPLGQQSNCGQDPAGRATMCAIYRLQAHEHACLMAHAGDLTDLATDGNQALQGAATLLGQTMHSLAYNVRHDLRLLPPTLGELPSGGGQLSRGAAATAASGLSGARHIGRTSKEGVPGAQLAAVHLSGASSSSAGGAASSSAGSSAGGDGASALLAEASEYVEGKRRASSAWARSSEDIMAGRLEALRTKAAKAHEDLQRKTEAEAASALSGAGGHWAPKPAKPAKAAKVPKAKRDEAALGGWDVAAAAAAEAAAEAAEADAAEHGGLLMLLSGAAHPTVFDAGAADVLGYSAAAEGASGSSDEVSAFFRSMLGDSSECGAGGEAAELEAAQFQAAQGYDTQGYAAQASASSACYPAASHMQAIVIEDDEAAPAAAQSKEERARAKEAKRVDKERAKEAKREEKARAKEAKREEKARVKAAGRAERQQVAADKKRKRVAFEEAQEARPEHDDETFGQADASEDEETPPVRARSSSSSSSSSKRAKTASEPAPYMTLQEITENLAAGAKMSKSKRRTGSGPPPLPQLQRLPLSLPLSLPLPPSRLPLNMAPPEEEEEEEDTSDPFDSFYGIRRSSGSGGSSSSGKMSRALSTSPARPLPSLRGAMSLGALSPPPALLPIDDAPEDSFTALGLGRPLLFAGFHSLAPSMAPSIAPSVFSSPLRQ